MFDKIITGIITIGSLFYSTISGVSPRFASCDLDTKGDTITLSSSITNCYSEDLDKMFNSGQEIKIQYKIRIYNSSSRKPLSAKTLYHSLKYSLLKRDYVVYYSETNEIFEVESLREAKSLLNRISGYVVLSRDDLLNQEAFYIKLSAALNKIYLEGIDKEVNLMYYWNSIKPEIKTEQFTQDIFKQ